MNDECQEYDTYSILPSFPTKSRTWDRAGNSHSHGSVCHRNTPSDSDSLAVRLVFAQTTHTRTRNMPPLPSYQLPAVGGISESKDLIRSKKQFHQSGQDGATADTSLDSVVVKQLCYKLFVLLAQLSTSQLSALQGPARQNGSITALVTALRIFFFFGGENSSQPLQISWIWLAQRQAVEEQLQAVSAEWRFPHPKIADRCY